MWYVMASFGMDLTRMPHSCEFFKFDHPSVKTVTGIVGGILFLLGSVCRRYMDVAPLSVTPKFLSLFYIFCGGGR